MLNPKTGCFDMAFDNGGLDSCSDLELRGGVEIAEEKSMMVTRAMSDYKLKEPQLRKISKKLDSSLILLKYLTCKSNRYHLRILISRNLDSPTLS